MKIVHYLEILVLDAYIKFHVTQYFMCEWMIVFLMYSCNMHNDFKACKPIDIVRLISFRFLYVFLSRTYFMLLTVASFSQLFMKQKYFY